MNNVTAFIRRHPLLTYFALTFAISWGGVLVVAGPGGISVNREPPEALLPFVYLAMLVGPSVAGILLTSLIHGRPGLRELLSRLLTWRMAPRWYGVALLTAPLVIAAILLTLSLRSAEFLPGIVRATAANGGQLSRRAPQNLYARAHRNTPS